MAEIDQDARRTSLKVLKLSVLIIMSSLYIALLYKLIKSVLQNAMYEVRRLMLMPLTFGWLLFALFSLVVNAEQIFDESYGILSCSNWLTVYIYASYYLPFVYAMGLITMAAEIFLQGLKRPKPQLVQSLDIRFSWLTRLFYVSFPWLFGLVLVLPLTMAEGVWEFDSCLTKSMDRLRVCLVISALGIAIIVITIILSLFMRHRAASTNSAPAATLQTFPNTHTKFPVCDKIEPLPQQPGYPINQAQCNELPPPYSDNSSCQFPLPYDGFLTAEHGVCLIKPRSHHRADMKTNQQYHDEIATDHNFKKGVTGSEPHCYPGAYTDPNYHHHNHPPIQSDAPAQQGIGYQHFHTPAPDQMATLQVSAATRNLDLETDILLVAGLIYFFSTLLESFYLADFISNKDISNVDPSAVSYVQDTYLWMTVCRSLMMYSYWFFVLK